MQDGVVGNCPARQAAPSRHVIVINRGLECQILTILICHLLSITSTGHGVTAHPRSRMQTRPCLSTQEPILLVTYQMAMGAYSHQIPAGRLAHLLAMAESSARSRQLTEGRYVSLVRISSGSASPQMDGQGTNLDRGSCQPPLDCTRPVSEMTKGVPPLTRSPAARRPWPYKPIILLKPTFSTTHEGPSRKVPTPSSLASTWPMAIWVRKAPSASVGECMRR